MIKGIDISEFNGIIDFKKVAKEVDFIMIRATFGRKKEDKLFHKNVKGCIENSIPFGLYYYSYAVDEETAKEEANFFISKAIKYKDYINYPLCIDMEDSDNYKKERNALTKENCSNICKIGCNIIKEAGFIPMIYANKNFYDNYLDEEILKDFPKWIAWWNVEESKINKTKYSMWQSKSTGVVEGIGTKVDMNISFFDYLKYTTYLNNIIKINEIKLIAGLQDITIQYLSSYKNGQYLIDTINKRIKEAKIKRKPIKDIELELPLILMREFKFSEDDLAYLKYYIYYDNLIQKLYFAISEVK